LVEHGVFGDYWFLAWAWACKGGKVLRKFLAVRVFKGKTAFVLFRVNFIQIGNVYSTVFWAKKFSISGE